MQTKDRIESSASDLTAGERKLAASILSDYPYAGLMSIQELASRSEVSAASISRFVTKIGFSGYPEFQRNLIDELKEGERSPLDIHKGQRQIEGGFLQDFIAKATSQMEVATQAITEDQFDRICARLSDPRGNVYVIGGRVSNAVAEVLSFHLRQMRAGVYHLPSDPEVWPEYVLRMRPVDTLFVADFRRYQTGLAQLCKTASEERNTKVILMTDKWLSPIAKHASEIMPVPIDVGTLWDTYSAALTVIEAIATKIAEANWEQTRERIMQWDRIRDIGKDISK
ncbi:MAG: MurR/RpiR family transcriptional regulator [Rhizobiaceae bacterium]